MTIEEAIQTALEYEKDVRDFYREAVKKVDDPKGKKICKVLADEEQEHVDYLARCLSEWRKTGKVNPVALKTSIPSPDVIAEAASKASGGMLDADRGTELEMLGKALEAERRTSGFYNKMVAELPIDGKELFKHFVEIEEGHLAIVQAEIDSVSGIGAWFDILEITL